MLNHTSGLKENKSRPGGEPLQSPCSKMASLNTRSTGLLAAMTCAVALITACGSSTPVSQPSADKISGAASCPAAESQSLTFSGALTGHVSCSTSPALCSTTSSTPSLTLPLNALIGSKAVQLLVAFRFFRDGMSHDQPGTYAAGRLGDAQDSSSYGATLDGYGHWETPTPGGSMTLSADDAAGASGAIDIKLTLAARTFAVAGSWRCVKPAGP
jgi:hypothetical protein